MKCCVVFSAGLIRQILSVQQHRFPPFFPGALGQFLEYGALPLCQGEEQLRRSELMKGAFSEERVKSYAETVIAKVLELRDRWRPGTTVEVIEEMERFTWDTLVAVIIGRDVEVPRKIGKDLLDFMKAHIVQDILPLGQLLKKLPLPVFRRGYTSGKQLDDVVYHAIERARDPSHPGDDVISHYVRTRENGSGEFCLDSDRAIRDEIWVLLNAFVDAPVGALVFGMDLIGRNPAVRDRLEREIEEVLVDRLPEPADFDRLPYMRAVLNEVLRLEPPTHVLLPKKALEDCEVGGYLIPKGTLMHVAMRVLHHRPEHWDQPDDFRPERWLDGSARVLPPESSHVPPHAYIPFGFGPHICRGTDVATRLFVLGIATIMQKLRCEPVTTSPPKRNDTAVGVKGKWHQHVRERKNRRCCMDQ